MRYILSLIILISFTALPQNLILLNGKGFYTYTPLNVGATASTDQIIFSGASTRTKSNKTDGSSKAYQRWMRWWIDSTQVITNRTFDSNITGWDTFDVAPATYEWLASDGGFTGTMHILTRVNNSGILNDTVTTLTGKYRLQFSINITSLTATGVYGVAVGGRTYQRLFNATGTFNVDTVLTYNIVNNDAKILFHQYGVGEAEFYVDNISWFPIVDSVSGYSKTLDRVSEDIPYYYSQSGQYLTKTDTIYASAEVDTTYSLVSTPSLQNVNGGIKELYVNWADASNGEDGYEVSYSTIVSGGEWTNFDTTLSNISNITITGLSDATTYMVRVRALGTYSNSDYSNILNGTTQTIIDSSDYIAPLAPTNVNAANLTKSTPPVLPDTIPTVSSFANISNAVLSSYHQAYIILSNLDSCWVNISASDSMKKGALGIYGVGGFKGYSGDTIYTAIVASASNSTLISNTITAGGVSRTFSVTTIASGGSYNLWYVDYNTPAEAEETWDGTSWTTAWKYLGANSGGYGGIDWSVIGDGDTIYISGGTDSLRYLSKFSGQAHFLSNESGTEYTFDPPVVVCPSWETGKNGRVVLSILDDPSATRGILQMGNTVNGMKVTGLTIRDIRTPDISPASVMISIFGNNNILEKDTIITAGMTTGIGFQGYNITIKDNYYEEPVNQYVFGNDPIGGMGGTGTIIEGNTFILRNNYTAVPNQTANASVTTTATTLSDTRINETTNYHVGITIQVNGNWNMTVTSNTGGTFTGSAGWEYATYTVAADVGNTYGTNYLYDANYTYADDYFKGTTITADGKTMVVASNTGHYVYGTTNWAGGTPANTSAYSFSASAGSYPPQGCAWRMEGAHRDGMQFSAWDSEVGAQPSTDTSTTIIRNNILVDEGIRGTGWNGLIYTSSVNAHQRWLVYNNIFVSKQEISSSGIFLYTTTPTDFMSMKFFNNTIIIKGSGSRYADGRYSSGQFFNFEDFDSLEVKNNLWVCDSTMAYMGKISTSGYEAIDFNVYAYDAYNTETFAFATGGGDFVDLADWNILGFDNNSVNTTSSTVTFSDKYSSTAGGYYTTTGRDLGEDLSAYFDTDILGNSKNVGSWDIGALEYQGGGMSEVLWQRIKPFLRNDETDFWKGQK